MALHNCDEVAVAGFGYDMTAPQAPLHYYESVKMSAIKEVSFIFTTIFILDTTEFFDLNHEKWEGILLLNRVCNLSNPKSHFIPQSS